MTSFTAAGNPQGGNVKTLPLPGAVGIQTDVTDAELSEDAWREGGRDADDPVLHPGEFV